MAQECDQGVHVPKNLASHCDTSTAVLGTVKGDGTVAFSPNGVTLVDGNACTDKAHRSCPRGGTREIAVSDSDNASVGVETPVIFAP